MGLQRNAPQTQGQFGRMAATLPRPDVVAELANTQAHQQQRCGELDPASPVGSRQTAQQPLAESAGRQTQQRIAGHATGVQ